MIEFGESETYIEIIIIFSLLLLSMNNFLLFIESSSVKWFLIGT